MLQTSQIIKSLSDVIKRKFHPDKVILFGSYAYGTPGNESDIDLMVIMNTNLSVREQAYLIRRELQSRIPVDVIVRTPAQIDQRLGMGDFFINQVIQDGIIL